MFQTCVVTFRHFFSSSAFLKVMVTRPWYQRWELV